MTRHRIIIDEELNVKIDSNNEETHVSLAEGESLACYSQLLTIMYVLTEPSSYGEEGTDEEWLETESFEPTIEIIPEEAPVVDPPMLEETSTKKCSKQHKCSYCPKTFSRPIRRREHENIHTGQKPYVCPSCSRPFSTSSMLFAHSQLHHGVQNHACPECGKKFNRRRNMRLHHQLVHLKEKPYACPICQRPYTDYACYRRHIKVHSHADTTASKSHISTTPGKAPKQQERKRKPVQRAPKPTKPTNCPPKGTRRKRNTLPKNHRCELCGALFARRRNVEYHVKYTHTGIKPHECEFCGKKYADITSFKRHIRAHTEIALQQDPTQGVEEIVFQRRETTGAGGQDVSVLPDLSQNTVFTSYLILNPIN
ncbi:zinc finger protein ZFP69 [Anopheles sinensis]|uniref:Zinc finger protein ZFP69 n=1 Tax=Anopheles sinensis TaxID=74873 RepID=A0A084W9A3_ANOSI|nr:zinc finger protein ZFP69 [Anopheles sinensis]